MAASRAQALLPSPAPPHPSPSVAVPPAGAGDGDEELVETLAPVLPRGKLSLSEGRPSVAGGRGPGLAEA